jgi:tetratricopeptide (TPR) repeat protein
MMARPGTHEFRAAEGFEMAKAFTKADAEKHKALTARGWELTSVHLLPYGQEPSRRPGGYGQWHLRWAARCFERALEIHPEGWPSMWALGKIYQLLGDPDVAFLWFAKANAERPNHPDLVRDAGRAAMDIGRAEEALALCRAAVAFGPDDPVLVRNLALAHCLAGEDMEAGRCAAQAVQLDPDDIVSATVLDLVRDVAAGRRGRPRTLTEVFPCE